MQHPKGRIRVALAAACMCSLFGCGGDTIYHPDPSTHSTLFKEDVVVFGPPPDEKMPAAARGAPVVCHYRRAGSEELSEVRMELVLYGHRRPLYAAHVPGVQSGEVEYYFTFTNSNLDVARVPLNGFFKAGGRRVPSTMTGGPVRTPAGG